MPMITEVSESIGGAKPKKPVQTSTSRSTTRAVAGEGRALTQASSGGGGAVVERTPKFKLTKEPQESENPDFLVAEIELPGTRSSRELTLDLGGDRIVVEARKCGYLLDVFIPFDIDQDGAGAEFHRENQVLTVTMPLVK
jgi:HSP20 family molecular chaperone IbpA